MPGWRVAMISSNKTFISWILKVKSNIDNGSFRGIQLAAAEAILNNTDEWHRENNIANYRRRRDIAEEIPFAVVGEEIPQFSIAEYVDGGIEPYTFSSSDLPSGLSISSDGTISGAYAKPYSSLLNGNQQAHAATIVVYDKSGQRAVQTKIGRAHV